MSLNVKFLLVLCLVGCAVAQLPAEEEDFDEDFLAEINDNNADAPQTELDLEEADAPGSAPEESPFEDIEDVSGITAEASLAGPELGDQQEGGVLEEGYRQTDGDEDESSAFAVSNKVAVSAAFSLLSGVIAFALF